MSLSFDLKTLRNAKTYSKIPHPKRSISDENAVNTSASSDPERIEEPANRTLHELLEEMIKANLAQLNQQISALTQLLKKLIQESSARNSLTAETRTQQTQARRSPGHEVGTPRALPARKIGSTGSPPDWHASTVYHKQSSSTHKQQKVPSRKFFDTVK